MEIVSKSIYRSNAVFVIDEKNSVKPDNSALMGLYQGEAAVGANFIDDPILKIKVFNLPKLKLQITLEPSRLIIEELPQGDSLNPDLASEALNIYQKLFPSSKPIGFGFNFDLYYRTSEFINIKNIMEDFLKGDLLEKADLVDYGFQFSLSRKGDKKEGYFLKITSPLEIAVHANHHYENKQLPDTKEIKKIFEKCYNETDEVVGSFEF